MKEFLMTKTSPVAQTPKGKLRGFRYDGVDHFLGIRYAKAKRFRMPEPVPAWEGVKDATCYGLICPVLNEPAPAGELMIPHRFWPASEHCQYLNVWTPALDDKKRPVLFWIHGGGYSAGSSIEQVAYDGFALAKEKDVVVVTVNHRLNAFGYMDLSAFGPEYRNSVNVGMADLVEALRWVRDNIAVFGGDPGNVTIFGQSGGGGKVTVLGQIPEADGLFHRMIVMSGVISGRMFDSADPKGFALEVLNILNIPEDQISRLEKVPVPQFIWAVNKATARLAAQGKHIGWAPRPNDYYLCDPLEGDFTAHSLTVLTMVGTVGAEFAFATPDLGERSELTLAKREELVKKSFGDEGGELVLKEFRKQYPRTNEVYAMDLDTMFLPGTVEYVKKKASKGGAPVYNYLFTKVFGADGGRMAWHCSDIPFFFRDTDLVPLYQEEGVKRLETLVNDALVNFARTGDPNGGDLPRWDPCRGDKLVTMVLDDRCEAKTDMHDKLLPLIQQYKIPAPPRPAPPKSEDDEESGSAWLF